jgi:peptidoglycan L-alanyl-D-glutamate endopeptidase CwlK
MSKIDQVTLFRINTLHPKIRKEVKSIYLNKILPVLPKDITCRFTYTLRTFQEQADLYALGRTKPGKKVTNALPGQSFHQYGLALDYVLLKDTNGDNKFETVIWDVNEDWKDIAREFKAHGYTWGGDFKKFVDYPHVEKTFGYTWQQMKALYDAKKFDSEGYIIL